MRGSVDLEVQIKPTGHTTPGGRGEEAGRQSGVSRHLCSTSGLGLVVLAFYEAHENRVRKHFFCVHKIPGDEVEETYASILPKGTNLEKKHSQSKLQDGAKATWAAEGSLNNQLHRERLWKSQSLLSPTWVSCSIWSYCQPGRIYFPRELVCFNLSVILFPLQFLLHLT